MERACEEGKHELHLSRRRRHVQDKMQPACRATVDWLNMRLVPTHGGILGYFAHALTKLTEARLSQTSQNVRIGGFSPPPLFFLCPLPPTWRPTERVCSAIVTTLDRELKYHNQGHRTVLQSSTSLPTISVKGQPGAVKLVLWRHWMHATQAHSVMSENQFNCTRLSPTAERLNR